MSTIRPQRVCLVTFLLATVLVLALAPGAFSLSLSRGRVAVRAADPSAVTLEMDVTVTAGDGESADSVTLYLVDALTVTAVESDGAALSLRSEPLAGTSLTGWTVTLPAPLASGASRSLSVRAGVTGGGPGTGIATGADGGYLLPGAGWFPAVEPTADAVVPHATRLEIPDHMTSVACGEASGQSGHLWTSTLPGRPFAVWGSFEVAETVVDDRTFRTYARAGGAPAPVKPIAERIAALEVGLDEAGGSGDWKLVDLGLDACAGGLRTLFLDDAARAAGLSDDERILRERDLAIALAGSFWTDCLRFHGDQAAWLSRAVPQYLGDIVTVVVAGGDEAFEARVIGPRRDAFVDICARGEDRPLAGLPLHSAAAAALLPTRGTLVLHMSESGAASRSHWVKFLSDVREEYGSASLDGAEFAAALERRFPNQHTYVTPLVETTDLPDVMIAAHGMGEGRHADRLRVVVENAGPVDVQVELAAYAPDGTVFATFSLRVPGMGAKTAMLARPNRITRIELDPRGAIPQADLTDEVVELTPAALEEPGSYYPSFPFSVDASGLQLVSGLELGLESVTISGFEGWVLPYATRHGVSGACLIGSGSVRIAPPAPFADSFAGTLGQATYEGKATDLWIRFPLAVWERIATQLAGRAPHEDGIRLRERAHRIFSYSFPSYFFEDQRAQLPPPGSGLAIFTDEDGLRLGFVEQPRPDGTRQMRLWEVKGRATRWEETR